MRIKRSPRCVNGHVTFLMRNGPLGIASAKDVPHDVAVGILDGKIVLVTGAGRGLGASIADRCVRDGATVLVGDIEFVDEALGAVRQIELDVTDRQAWSRVADIVRDDHGRLDVLVNNAGILRAAPLRDVTVDEFRQTFDVNVVGALHGIQTFLELHDAASGGAGSIVNIASVRGLVGGHGLGSYSASKFALRGLTKVAAIELGPVGVRVNAVCPGPVVTDMMMADQLGHLDWDGYLAQVPVGRFGRPDDIAAAVCWLASDDSTFVSGTEIIVDGGLTASGISPQPRGPH
jgi:3alpha(or 20beta)-hydroxysteroid dehydrogenase